MVHSIIYTSGHGSQYSSSQTGEGGSSCVDRSSGVPVGVVECGVADHGIHHAASGDAQQQNTAQQLVPITYTMYVTRGGKVMGAKWANKLITRERINMDNIRDAIS